MKKQQRFLITWIILCSMLLMGCARNNEEDDTETITETITETVHEFPPHTSKWSTSGYRHNTVEYRDKETAQAYREVLKSERRFVSIDEGNEETYLKDFDYFRGEQGCETAVKGFRVFDCDEDENYEIQITLLPAQGKNGIAKELLFYEDGIVYGIQLPEWVDLLGDRLVGWDNAGHPNRGEDTPYYSGYARIRFQGRKLVYTYLFEKAGSPEEEWLRTSGMLGEQDSIEYSGKEHENPYVWYFRYNDWYELRNLSLREYIDYEEIDQYLKGKMEEWEEEEKKQLAVIEYRDKEVAQAYREVLKSERRFVSIDEGNEETYLKDFDYFRGEQGYEVIVKDFHVFDYNGDENYEIELTLLSTKGKNSFIRELLFYEDGVVYGIQLPKWSCMHGDRIVGWDNTGYLNLGEDTPYYDGYARIRFEDRELIYTYLFEKQGSPEEEWLRASGVMGEKDSIEYLGKEYENQSDWSFKYDDWYVLHDRNSGKYIGYEGIDQYLR